MGGPKAFALKIAQPFMAGSSVKQTNQVPSGTKEMFARPWISFVPDGTGKRGRRFFPAMNGWPIFTSLPVLHRFSEMELRGNSAPPALGPSAFLAPLTHSFIHSFLNSLFFPSISFSR